MCPGGLPDICPCLSSGLYRKHLSTPLAMLYRSLVHDSFVFLLNKENHWIRREMCYRHMKDKPLWLSVSSPERRTRAGGAWLNLGWALSLLATNEPPKTIWAPSDLSCTTRSEPLPDSPPERRCFSLKLNCLLGWSQNLGWKYFSTPLWEKCKVSSKSNFVALVLWNKCSFDT